MKNFILLLGPAIMIFIGLQLFNSVRITFCLFYGWLLVIPMSIKITICKEKKVSLSSSIILGTVSGLLCGAAFLITCSLFLTKLFDLESLKSQLIEWNFSGSHVFLLVFILVFINPLLEEMYWRTFMLNMLKETIGPAKSILVTAFFYSLYHLLSLIPMFVWPFPIVAALPVFLAGVLWGIFKEKTGTNTASIISHIFADLAIMFVYLLFIR
ncbi:CPBP family intramembrane glutamic endopeptidase [Falsibacillus albus]|uniref:CPBP family intramembrane metalloprotease n=1 Tax=Falsibacillus albus TaxID=2478915 RepID=A0A3L7K116_9BACI|nr:type II CAAX endopeptidase family protein [Falsibacillus albus]RLQ94342.1 CPBP family intramembrane metalloprotease [Falsibacillus albus]